MILITGQRCAIVAGCKHTRHSRGNEQARQGSLANPLIAFHLPPPLISLGFRGDALLHLPYVAEVFTRYPRGVLGLTLGVGRRWVVGLGGGGKAYIYTVEWCNLHEIPVNRERKPSGAAD